MNKPWYFWLGLWAGITIIPSGILALISQEWITFQMSFIMIGLISGLILLIIWLPRRPHSKSYPFEIGGPARLVIKWRGSFMSVKVIFDGTELALNYSDKEFIKGVNISLPDGSKLFLKFDSDDFVKFRTLPDISRDGKPLPGSKKDPRVELNSSGNMFLAGAVVNLIYGIFWASSNPPWYTALLFAMGFTAIFVGVYVKKYSKPALQIGVVLCVISVLTFLPGLANREGFFDILMDFGDSILNVFGAVKGFAAIKKLELEKQTNP